MTIYNSDKSPVVRPHKFVSYDGKYGREVHCVFCGCLVHMERALTHYLDKGQQDATKGCPTSNLLTAEEKLKAIELRNARVTKNNSDLT